MDVLGEFASKVREFSLPSGVITLDSVKELKALLRWASYVIVNEELTDQLKPTFLELIGKAEAFFVMLVRSYVSLVATEFNSSEDFEYFRRQIFRYRPYVDGATSIARDIRLLCAAVDTDVSRDFEIANDVFSQVRYAVETAGDFETFRNLFVFAIGGTPFEELGELKKAVPDMKVRSSILSNTRPRKRGRLIGPLRPFKVLRSLLIPLRARGHR